jgi:hypothetical protein
MNILFKNYDFAYMYDDNRRQKVPCILSINTFETKLLALNFFIFTMK